MYLMILCSLHLYSGAQYTNHYPYFRSKREVNITIEFYIFELG